MYSFKKTLIAFVSLLVLFGAIAALTPLASQGQGQGKKQSGPRKFYLTQTTHDGSQALSACAEGYHMASLWEILDPSNLSYDTTLGFTTADSGSGPPATPSFSWIRTGNNASNGSLGTGQGNCLAWTSADNAHAGTAVFLSNSWDSGNVTAISPWVSGLGSCNFTLRVWCVQD